MALTMTRTRTQTTLNKLALMVANVQGELVFVESLLAQGVGPSRGPAGCCIDPGVFALLEAQQQKLLVDREALYATLRQFDPELAPESIGVGADWKLRFGRQGLGDKPLGARYFNALRKTII